MLSLKVSQCDRRLNFSPVKPWPVALPAIAWKGWLLSGFEREEGPAIEVSSLNMPFVAAFTSCHAKLSLSELARLRRLAELASFELGWEDLLSHYGLRASDSLDEVLKRLVDLPAEFQDWVSLKELGSKDLAILRSFAEIDALRPLCTAVAVKSASKSTGVQILEWGGELLLMNLPEASVLPLANEDADSWCTRLKALRHPETTAGEEVARKKWLSLPWPSLSQIKWIRKGDESGLEIRFMVSSREDLRKKLKGLEHVQKMMDEQQEPEWPH